MADLTSPFVVVGMNRSGTSLTTMLLQSMGVFFGNPSDVFSADSSNEGGYWEHKRISWVNRRFELSLALPNLGIDPLPANWLANPHSRGLLEALKKEIARSFEGRALSGWKDPDNSWFLPFTIHALKELGLAPTIIICVRNPMEVAKSQFERSRTPIERTLLSWLRHTLAAMDDSRDFARVLVPFEELMGDTASLVGRLREAIPGSTIPESSPVKPERRHQVESSLPSLGLLTRMLEETAEVAKDPAGFSEGKYDQVIHGLRVEFDDLARLFQAPLPAALITVYWDGQKSSVDHYPNRDWQSIRVPVPTSPNLPLVVQLYGTPGHVWVRTAKWRTDGGAVEAWLQAGPHAGLQEHVGMQCFQLSAGPDQVRVTTPGCGASELEMEVYYEFSSFIASSHSKVMLDTLGL